MKEIQKAVVHLYS